MKYIEAAPHLRLRPSHLLLMVYRYLSGIYQTGDLSALSYVKGFIDGRSMEPPRRILTISGHGIGEAEMWLASRIEGSSVDAISFRLIDTQLLQFLRAAEQRDIETVFARFATMVSSYDVLRGLIADPGLVPYWSDQAAELKYWFQERRLSVYSDDPLRIAPPRPYDLIYVSDGSQFFTHEALQKLRSVLRPGGLLAVLLPWQRDRVETKEGHRRFAGSALALEARRLFRAALEARGYTLGPFAAEPVELDGVALRRELIRFSVLAPANAVLMGELILSSLYEHISDRSRLEVLAAVAAGFRELRAPVHEELVLGIVEATD